MRMGERHSLTKTKRHEAFNHVKGGKEMIKTHHGHCHHIKRLLHLVKREYLSLRRRRYAIKPQIRIEFVRGRGMAGPSRDAGVK